MDTLKLQSNGPLYNNMVIGTLVADGWAVTFDMVRRGLLSLLLAVPNVTPHPSVVSVPTSYFMWQYNFFCTLKVKGKGKCIYIAHFL